MSLRVWLPLNGDLRNNGLDNFQVNGTPHSWVNGKIGKCLHFEGAVTNKIYINTDKYNYTDNFSWSIWVKTNYYTEQTSGAQYIFTVGRADGSTWGYGFQCISTTYCQVKFGSNTWRVEVTGGEWTHIAFTKSGNTCKIYKNGVLYSTNTFSGTMPEYTQSLGLGLGCFYYTGGSIYPYYGDLNDFRIYDHALSAKEVKEISKGLVCHYPLNNNAGQENLFNWGNKGNEIITLNDYHNTGSFTQFTNCLTFDAKDTVGTTYTISFWAKSPNGTTALQLYNNNGTPRYFYFSPTILTTNLDNEWQYFTYTFTNQDRGSGTTTASTYNRIEIYMPSKMGGQVKLIKIEEGDKATIWSPAPSDTYYNKLGYDKNIIYDTSGNKNNATPKNITYSSNTVRNSISAVFNGTNSFIACGRGSMITDEITINFWGYSNNWATINTLTSCTEGGGFSVSRTSNNISVYMGTGTTSNTYKTITSTTTVQNLSSGWHMFTVTYDGLNLKFYIDGILDKTNTAYTTKTPIFYHPSNGLFIGAEASNNQVTPAGGYSDCQISDYRIYGVALLEDDIKELYQVGASIDKDGNVFAYEFKED